MIHFLVQHEGKNMNAKKESCFSSLIIDSGCIGGLRSWRMETNAVIINNVQQSSARCGSGHLLLNQTNVKGVNKSWACKSGGTRSDSDTSFSVTLTHKMFYS